MTEVEAIKMFNDLLDVPCEMLIKYDSVINCEQKQALVRLRTAEEMAIKALGKQEKIKEAFEMWKAETGGYYGADDETTRFISTLNQTLRSDEE